MSRCDSASLSVSRLPLGGSLLGQQDKKIQHAIVRLRTGILGVAWPIGCVLQGLVLPLALTAHNALLTALKWKSMLHAASHCLCPLLART